jgi:hypothetical protein
MHKPFALFLSALICVALLGAPVAAGIDSFFCQGILTDDFGDPVADGSYLVEFSIWDAETGGTMRWSETQAVTTVGGNFTVYVGSVNPIDEDVFDINIGIGEIPYLQIKIEADPPMTRMLIGGSPLAFTASRIQGDLLRTEANGVFIGNEGQDALVVIAQPAPNTAEIRLESGSTPTTLVDIKAEALGGSVSLRSPNQSQKTYIQQQATDLGTGMTFFQEVSGLGEPLMEMGSDIDGGHVKLIGNSPLQPCVDIGALPGGGHVRLIGSSPLEPFIDMTADSAGGHVRLIGQSPLRPGIELDATDQATGLRIGTTTQDYFRAATDTDGFCLDVLIPGIPLPQWGLCSNYSQGTINMNVADLAILRAGPEGPHFTMNDTGGGEWFKVEEGEGMVLDPTTLERTTLHSGGLRGLNTSGEQWYKVEKGESVIYDPTTQARMRTHAGGIDGFNAGGNPYFKVEEGEGVIFDPATLAKTVMQPGGINVYNSGGILSAVFEPNGVSALSANFGSSNTKTGTNTFVAGNFNTVNGNFSSVGGGTGNTASGGSATVAGGIGNDALFGGAFVGGGNSNTASGLNSTVPGGTSNSASGAHSFAAGRSANANHEGSFVWSDASGASVTSDIANQFKVRATGGTIVMSDTNPTSGVRLSKGSSVWQSLSDRNAKRNIRRVDTDKILELLQQLDVQRWSYKAESADIEHMGPMAQDFYALFGLGEDERHLTSLDLAGVALASIQALNARLNELEVRTAELEKARADAALQSASMTTLVDRIKHLERLMADKAPRLARVDTATR